MMERKLLIIALVALVGGCTDCSNKKESETNKVGKYVYLDSYGILHVRRKCEIGIRTTYTEGANYFNPIRFIDTTQLTKKHLETLCWCIEDEHYDQLKNIVEENDAPSLNWGKDEVDNETDW